eukprot:117633_1
MGNKTTKQKHTSTESKKEQKSPTLIINMSDEKENTYIDDNDEEIDDSDEEIDDEYKIVEKTDNLLASGIKKRAKQNEEETKNEKTKNEKTKIEIKENLISIKRNEEPDDIQKCIGQVVISWDGSDDDYYYGTGTVYKKLEG